jgi:hypothetical protein
MVLELNALMALKVLVLNQGFMKETVRVIPISWVDYVCTDKFDSEVVIPLSIATTVVAIKEAGRKDIQPYIDNQKISNVSDFENASPVPPISGSDLGTYTTALNTFAVTSSAVTDDSMGLMCAAAQPRSLEAAKKFYANQLAAREFLRTIFAERNRCIFYEAGLPIPDDATLDEIGNSEVDKLRAYSHFFKTGSIPQYQQELACAELKDKASTMSASMLVQMKAICDGTYDSDGDGVPDLKDRCITPRILLQKGYKVKANGCVFEHEASLMPIVDSVFPGSITVKK